MDVSVSKGELLGRFFLEVARSAARAILRRDPVLGRGRGDAVGGFLQGAALLEESIEALA